MKINNDVTDLHSIRDFLGRFIVGICRCDRFQEFIFCTDLVRVQCVDGLNCFIIKALHIFLMLVVFLFDNRCPLTFLGFKLFLVGRIRCLDLVIGKGFDLLTERGHFVTEFLILFFKALADAVHCCIQHLADGELFTGMRQLLQCIIILFH